MVKREGGGGNVETFHKLIEAGFDLDALAPPQRKVLAELSADEVDVLVNVRGRLRRDIREVAEEVAADSVGVFYY